MTVGFDSQPLNPGWVRLRWLLISLSLVTVAYFALLTAVWPHPGFDFETQRDGSIVVYDPVPGSSAAAVLRTGDVIQAVDGWPTTRVADWHWLFPPSSQYTYQVMRGVQIFTVDVAVIPMPLSGLLLRLMPYAVALSITLIGVLMLAFATPRNRAAWRAGGVFLTLGVTLASASGSIYFVPGAFTAFHGLMLVAAVGYAELALYPRATSISPLVRATFTGAYGVALGLTVLSLYEIAFVYPQGGELPLLGWSLSRWRLAVLALGLVAHPLLLALRYRRAPRSHYREQLRVLGAATLAAITPILAMVVLPQVLGLDMVALFGPFAYRAPLWFILLLPLTYGYVIYRHRYLHLDVFMTNALAAVLLGTLALVAYALATALLPRTGPTLTLFGLACLGVLPATLRPARRAAEALLYGRPAPYLYTHTRLVRALADSPDLETLRQGLEESLALLQVRQAALWLGTASAGYASVSAWQVTADVLPSATLLPNTLTLRSQADNPPLFESLTWAAVLAPLRANGQNVGLLALGPRVPDETFAPHHLEFVRAVSETLGLAAHAFQLFEAARAMSRQLLQAQTAERARVAAEIHDDPLQRLSLAANELGRLAAQLQSDQPDAAALASAQQQALRSVTGQLRAICAGLRSPTLDAGFGWAARDAVYAFQSACPVTVYTQLPADLDLPETTTVALYHILTEALHNIRQHAQARQVWVEAHHQNGALRLSVRDDGRGLAVQSPSLAELARAGHFGLVGMHEWARLAEGELRVETPADGGTRITVTLPVRNHESQPA